jgi:vacuolar-type H+-ATPase subunit H
MALTAEQQALDFNPELQDVSRQRKLAELLMSQGMQQPQGQMISGYYVAPSITQQLNPIANILAGQAVGERADVKQTQMAEMLRKQGDAAAKDVMETYKQNPQAALAKASQYSQFPQVKALLPQLSKVALPEATTLEREFVAAKNQGYQGNINDFKNQMSDYQKIQAANEKQRLGLESARLNAGQIVETANGPMLVNTRTGEASPLMAGGQPLAPKLNAEQSKDITAINQQRAAVNGALQLVEATPSAFSFGRGLAGKLPAGETLAGRTEKPEQTEARSAVFNIVSKVINERAGAAQSAQELARLNAFLPSELDNAESIKRKLNGFNKYLNEQEKGTRINPNIPMQSQTPQAPQTPKKVVNFNDLP